VVPLFLNVITLSKLITHIYPGQLAFHPFGVDKLAPSSAGVKFKSFCALAGLASAAVVAVPYILYVGLQSCVQAANSVKRVGPTDL